MTEGAELPPPGPPPPVERRSWFPQTSGPLLAAVAPSHAGKLVDAFRAASEPVWIVGEAFDGTEGGIEIV